MKTYPFIVINKNNMKEIRHYATSSEVGVYLWGRQLTGIMIIINERRIIHVKDLNTSNVREIERVLDFISVDKSA